MNYNSLEVAVKAYSDREGIEVDTNFPTFVSMAEARINRILKTRKQSTRAYTPSKKGEEFYRLPPDFAGMRNIQANGGLPHEAHKSGIYEMVAPEFLTERRNEAAGDRRYYCIIADQIQIYPVLDAGYSIEMTYYQKVPALTSAAPTNWLIEEHEDIYVAGALAEVELFVKNYDVGASWITRMKEALSELSTVDDEERWSGPPMAMRTEL